MQNNPPEARHAIIYFDQDLHDDTGAGWILECSTWNLLSYRFESLDELLHTMKTDPYWHIELTGVDRKPISVD